VNTPGIQHYFKREFFTVTELDKFARCPRAYFYSAGCGLRQSDPTNTGQRAMNFGTAIHAALPILLSTHDFEAAYNAFLKAWEGNTEDDKRNTVTAKMILLSFAAKHPPIGALYTILPAPEHLQKIKHPDKISDFEIAFSTNIPGLPLPFIGRVDGWCRNQQGELWGLEYKTTSEMSERFLLGFKRNPQVCGYIVAMRAHGYPVKGVYIEAIGVAKTVFKSETIPIQPTDDDLEHFLRWAQITGAGILACEAAGEWPKDLSACTTYPQFGQPGYMCDFDPLCSVPDWTAMRPFYYVDRHLPYLVQATIKGEQVEQKQTQHPESSSRIQPQESALQDGKPRHDGNGANTLGEAANLTTVTMDAAAQTKNCDIDLGIPSKQN
jgi:hypothetical protein